VFGLKPYYVKQKMSQPKHVQNSNNQNLMSQGPPNGGMSKLPPRGNMGQGSPGGMHPQGMGQGSPGGMHPQGMGQGPPGGMHPQGMGQGPPGGMHPQGMGQGPPGGMNPQGMHPQSGMGQGPPGGMGSPRGMNHGSQGGSMGDPISNLPVDKNQPSGQELQIVNTLFSQHKGSMDSLAEEGKDLLIIAFLIILFSLPQADSLFNKFVPVTQKSPYILFSLRAISVVIIYWLIKHFYLSRS